MTIMCNSVSRLKPQTPSLAAVEVSCAPNEVVVRRWTACLCQRRCQEGEIAADVNGSGSTSAMVLNLGTRAGLARDSWPRRRGESPLPQSESSRDGSGCHVTIRPTAPASIGHDDRPSPPGTLRRTRWLRRRCRASDRLPQIQARASSALARRQTRSRDAVKFLVDVADILSRMQGAVPSGTVTFLFTDLVGSTALWDREPESMSAALVRHDAILRDAIGSRGGFVFSTGGDGFGVAFQRASDAVVAAIDAQRALGVEPWPVAVNLRVRMAIHTGEAVERDADFFGAAVNRAARVMSLASGGEVFVSAASAQMVGDGLPAGVSVVDLGDAELRGFGRAERVFALVGEGLARPSPLVTARDVQGNLGRAVSSFVGRDDDLAQLVGEARTRRLITLVGVGGVGKTRLALEVAGQLTDEFPDGVWVCELAALSSDSVAQLVLSVLRLRQQAEMSAPASVVDALRDRRLLLVLDNCEHLLDAVAGLAAGIRDHCPSVTVIATSREALGIEGERIWPVRSLDPLIEGVDLFVDRARDSGVVVAKGDDVAELCRRLDGIPLAIELAAARARTMSVAEISERLDRRFRLLRGGARGRVERHQTLHAMVLWSYDLLSHEQRALFSSLSVFTGGFTVEDVVAVCIPEADEFDVIDQLSSLVERSVLIGEPTAAEPDIACWKLCVSSVLSDWPSKMRLGCVSGTASITSRSVSMPGICGTRRVITKVTACSRSTGTTFALLWSGP